MKAFNWIAVIVILILAYFAYTQSRTIKKLKLDSHRHPNPSIDAAPQRMSGGEIWDTLRSSAEKMTIEMDFK